MIKGLPITFPNGAVLDDLTFYCKTCNATVDIPDVEVVQFPSTVATVKLSGNCPSCGQFAESKVRIRQTEFSFQIEELLPDGVAVFRPHHSLLTKLRKFLFGR